MAKITINKQMCKGCLLCITFCPKGAIAKGTALNKRGLTPVEFSDGDNCVGCAMCAVICPECCIEVYK